MTFALKKLPSLAAAGAIFLVALAILMLVNRPPPSLPGAGGSSITPQAYAELGGALLQRLRETGDPGLYARAEMAFAEALERDPRNLDATVGRGVLALSRHDFRAALRLGLQARRTHPLSFAPFAVLVDARVELGRYRAARRTLERMIDFKPGPASYARVSYFRELLGDLGGAVEAMRLAAAATPAAGENRSYIQTLLGNLELERGQPAAAEASYRMALAGFPGYAPAKAGLARLEAGRGRFEPAIDRLRAVVERLPLPEYVIALGETELAPAGRRRAWRMPAAR